MSKLTPQEAAKITSILLEFSSLNRQRQMVNELAAMGIDLEKFVQFERLRNAAEIPIGMPLIVDVHNTLSHIEKGIEVQNDELHRLPKNFISKASRAAFLALEKLDAANAMNAAQGEKSAEGAESDPAPARRRKP